MKYRVVFEKNADKQLQKIDVTQQRIIANWISNNLEDTENPRIYGIALKGRSKQYWRYQVGDYRLIADIQDRRILIVIVAIGHRKDIYSEFERR